jgi:hypothetical protein
MVAKAQTQSTAQFMQQLNIQPNNTPENYFRVMDSLMVVLHGNDSSENGPKNEYERAKTLFSTRSKAQFSNEPISIAYGAALLSARNRGDDHCDKEGNRFKGNWQNIGPRTDNKDYQNQGWVSAIWSEPGHPEHILIGTEGGGIWETKNTGDDWYNLTDNTPLNGTMGIQSIAVNPFDVNDIYIAAQIAIKTPMIGDDIGMGIWHSSNAGLTWNLETSGELFNILPSASRVYAQKIQFCPYKVNNESYVVTTIGDNVYSKLGSGSWMKITTNPLPSFFYATDIEFMPDMPGKFMVANEWGNVIWNDIAVYQIEFDLTTGGASNNVPTKLIDKTLNGQPINISPYNIASGATILSFAVEYMGNGNVYLMYNIHGPEVFCNAGLSLGYYSSIVKFNLNNINSFTNIVTGLNSPAQYQDIDFKASQTEDIMFVSLTNAIIIYKKNGTWEWKGIGGYSSICWDQFSDHTIHPDIRTSYIAVDDVNSDVDNKTGKNHVVYWGTDGGITKTYNFDVTTITSPNTFIPTSSCRISKNVNGNNLYIGDLWDADSEPYGNAYSSAGWHNGYQYYEKSNNTWGGTINGDGENATFDKRFSNGIDFTLLYKGGPEIDKRDFGANNTGSFNQPESPNLYRYSPMQFDEDKLNLGIVRPWQTQSSTNPTHKYFLGNTNDFDFDLRENPNFSQSSPKPIIQERWEGGTPCQQFMVAPSDNNIAYYLFQGTKKVGLLHRGEKDITTGKWDWVSRNDNLPQGGKDITPSVQSDLTWGIPVNDFIIHPTNANKIYLAMGGIYHNNTSNRVIMANDGGLSGVWTDMSTGLTDLPVNCIVYQNGSDDIMYIGCDDGVYYWNKPTSCWIKMNGYYNEDLDKAPNVIVTRLKINYCTGKLIAASYGRGIWESDLINYKPNDIQLPGITNTISTNTTWSDTKYIEGSILVKSGATLTITGIPNFTDNTSTTTINMAKMGAIYVEQGAKLVINGAKITNACSSNWYGIQAFGDGTLAQEYNSTTTRYDHQGFVVMNDAIIEHAEEAFKNYGGSLGTNGLNTGGIIAANHSVFLNNRRSAEFLKYDNTNSNGMVIKDKSYFTDCKFLLDANHRQDFDAHISMWAVNNIQLIGNEFKNNSTLKDYGAEEAIQTFDASYNVDNSGNQSTLFEGFNRAIKSSSFSKERPFSIAVQNATFDKNQIGINIDNVYGATIKGNTINIGERRSDLNGTWYASLGTLLESTTNFIYCSNTHNKLYNSPNSTVTQATEGIEAHNTGHDDLVIEKNSYSNLEVGTDFDYECGNPTNGGQSGAYFRWNQNNNNTRYDFSFLADAIIRKIQSANTATNNVATGNTFSGGITDIYHESITNSNAPVDYYHSNTGNEIPTTVFNVNPIATTISQIENPDCDKSIMADKSIKNEITNVELSTLKNEYNVHEILFDAYHQLYNQLVDGGNTAGHIADIESSNATQAMQIRTEMLALSPYVSAEVLRTLAEENILPNSILLEIILANPDASQRIEFIKYLQFEKTNPLPEYMITLIENSWDGSTPRSIMERSMAFEHYKMSSLKDQILLSYKYGNNYDEVDQLLWMNKLPSLSNRYDVIEYYLGKKQYTNAEAILNSLPTQYMMNEFENNEFSTYNTLYNFKKNLQQNNVSIHQLDSPRISQLKAIADNGLYSFARTMARDAMCFFYKVCYPYERKELPTPIMGKTKISDNKETPKEITVYPNPAKEYVAFYYNLTDGNKVINLIVSDVTGKLIYQSTLSNTSGQHIWDVKNISNGNYIYSITTKTGLKYSGKIVVQK